MVKVRACSKLLRNLDIAPGLGFIGRLDLMGKDHGREEGSGRRVGKREKVVGKRGRKLGYTVRRRSAVVSSHRLR